MVIKIETMFDEFRNGIDDSIKFDMNLIHIDKIFYNNLKIYLMNYNWILL
jgi:hypothetical protein